MSPTPTPASEHCSFMASLDPAMHSFDSDMSLTPARAVVEPIVIDNLAHDFKVEQKHRANMHMFVEIASSDGKLGKSDILARLYMLAVHYEDVAERHRLANDQGSMDIKTMYNDLVVRMSGTYEMTKEQQTNIRRTANHAIYQPNRTNFGNMHLDVMVKSRRIAACIRYLLSSQKTLRDNQNSMGLSNVFGQALREQVLEKAIRRTCSSVRNAFRQDIRDSIYGPNSRPLAQFTFHSANKYHPGLFEQGKAGLGYTIHNTILRRFGLDNPALIKSKSASEENEESGDAQSQGIKKRGRNETGRIPHGEDFWGRVDLYFEGMVQQNGRDLTGDKWKECVNEMIRRDYATFGGPENTSADARPESAGPVIAQGASMIHSFANRT
ncbi:hypothetical protein HWV62_11716 [Athelia sp. TMB]|nr:hypothetical protein HWV62_11716 [Athelia sp. TMB]